MSKLFNIFKTITFFVLFIVIVPMIFNFLSIPFSTYGLYFLWVIALGIFSVFLPKRNNFLFSKSNN